MAERKSKPESEQKATQPDIPETWITIAAYYIWKNEGEPEGKDVNYWERAKAELTNLWNEGKLPIERIHSAP